MSPSVLKIRASGVRGKTVRNGLVTEAVMSGCFSSAQQSTRRPRRPIRRRSTTTIRCTAIISILGSTLTTVL